MTSDKFSELWTQIGNAAQDIVNACGNSKVVSFNHRKRDYIEYEYEKFRKFCREKHMLYSNDSDIDSIRIDRHKVASCIAGAILSTKPLECNDSENGVQRPKIMYLANETLALFSSLAIVKSFIRCDEENTIQLDETLKAQFLERGFIFPTPIHDDYLPWILFLLQEGSNIGFNVLSFSNILYLLEKYTFAQLEIEQYKSSESIQQ